MTCARAALPALRVPRLAPRPARPSRGALVARRASGESSSTSSSSVETDPAAARARLEAAMADAVAAEDFTLAARLRDDLAAVNAADELYVATRALELAVLEERYDDAARLRDRVAELTPPPPPKVPTQSDVVTRGIRVVVLSQYVPSRSDPTPSTFAYPSGHQRSHRRRAAPRQTTGHRDAGGGVWRDPASGQNPSSSQVTPRRQRVSPQHPARVHARVLHVRAHDDAVRGGVQGRR